MKFGNRKNAKVNSILKQCLDLSSEGAPKPIAICVAPVRDLSSEGLIEQAK